jgi:hypothetical protein
MLHSEKLFEGTYECRHDDNGNAIHVYIQNDKAYIYQSMEDLVSHRYLKYVGIIPVEVSEDALSNIYESEKYSYDEIFFEEETMKRASKYQLEIQKSIQSAGFNVSMCGQCSATLLHKSSDESIECHSCGSFMQMCDCPDLNF